MFSLHDFIIKGLRDAIGRMADYQIILNAAAWQEKGVLELSDLAEIGALIDMKNAPADEDTEENTEGGAE